MQLERWASVTWGGNLDPGIEPADFSRFGLHGRSDPWPVVWLFECCLLADDGVIRIEHLPDDIVDGEPAYLRSSAGSLST